jgi:hypothetical protein
MSPLNDGRSCSAIPGRDEPLVGVRDTAAALRKPLNLSKLIATVRRILPTPAADYPEGPTPRD